MEFMNRGAQHPLPKPTNGHSGEAHTTHKASSRKAKHFGNLTSVAYFVLLFSGAILVVAVLLSLAFSRGSSEGRFVDKNNLQAVFLNNGQVYFGKIRAMDKGYVRLTNVYYLRVNSQGQDATQQNQASSSDDVSLAKLGCELHGPQDQMVINRDEITFWENLKDKNNSQVTKAVEDYIEANKDGQKCDATTNSTTQSNTTTNPTGNNQQ